MSDDAFVTTEALVQAMVTRYVPRLRGTRTPVYKQPALAVEAMPACRPEFVAQMRALCAQVDLTNRTYVSEDVAHLLRYHRMYGVGQLYKRGLTGVDLWGSPTQHEKWFLELGYHLTVLIGGLLLALLGPDAYAAWFPWNNFTVALDGDRGFRIHCTSLEHHVSAEGRPFYAAANAPTITLRGRTRRVAFAPHALERVADRAVATRSYASLGDVFGLIDSSQYYEPVLLHPRQDAFALFEECREPFVSAVYAEQILGTLDPAQAYVYRVGYCPVVEEGTFFVAKTVLVPGYSGTPEYQVLRTASLAPGVKERLLERCTQHSYAMLCSTRDFDLLRWFHTHGVPQVKRRVGQRLEHV